MTDSATRIVDTPEWRALQAHFEAIRDVHLRTLFADEPDRGETLCLEVGDLYLDYSKNRLTVETMSLLVALARRAGVEQLRDAMFAGEKVNITEERAVLHVALRAPDGPEDLRGRGRCRRRGALGPEQDDGLLDPGAQRCVDRAHRQADPQRRQRRHRRQRPRAADGHDRAGRLQ